MFGLGRVAVRYSNIERLITPVSRIYPPHLKDMSTLDGLYGLHFYQWRSRPLTYISVLSEITCRMWDTCRHAVLASHSLRVSAAFRSRTTRLAKNEAQLLWMAQQRRELLGEPCAER